MINLSIKYYATEEYVDAKVASAGGSSVLPEAGASQYLTTDEFGNVQWEDKLLYKGNRTVHIIHSDDATDHGEGVDYGRYSITLSLSAAGHVNPSPQSTISYPLTIYFDGEPYTVSGRALPAVFYNPTSKIVQLMLSNASKGITMGMSFDEPGEHILIIENGEDFYTKLDYGHMPDGYPTVMQNYTALTGVTARGTISDDGQIYSYDFSNLQLKHKQLYRVKFNQIDYFVTAHEIDTEHIVIGDAAIPYTTPPFYIIYDTVALKSTLYWNASGEANVLVSVVKIEDVLTPMDEKFLPETVASKEYVDEAIANIDVGTIGLTVDTELSTTSTNPVQNKVIADAMVGKKTTGTIYTINEEQVTAAVCAEVFNDYINNIASGRYAHAEGNGTQATGDNSHAEGYESIASGGNAHAEGQMTTASGFHSHTEGQISTASGAGSHAEGYQTRAEGGYSHAEGNQTTASGVGSHAEGYQTRAEGGYSHASGRGTIAHTTYEYAIGQYNVTSGCTTTIGAETSTNVRGASATVYRLKSEPTVDQTTGFFVIGEYEQISHTQIQAGDILVSSVTTGQTSYSKVTSVTSSVSSQTRYMYMPVTIVGEVVFVVGNGTSDSKRSNAHTIDWNGNGWYQGDVYVGGTNQDDGEKLAKMSDLELLANDFSTKADREHNHNDVYYTEAEIDTLLSEMASIERGGTGQTSIVDTTYVEPRYRASALVATETTPTENGVITWVYE